MGCQNKSDVNGLCSIEKLVMLIELIALQIILFLCNILFYGFISGDYASDYIEHINTVLSGQPGYSLMHRIIYFCYLFRNGNIVLTVTMSLVEFVTIIGVYAYVKKRCDDFINRKITLLISTCLMFTSNLYIPVIFPHLYNHYTTVSQPFHNSTYMMMRMFSVFAVIMYFIILEKIEENKIIQWKELILFCVSLTLCNYSKPNFFIAFAPVAFVTLVYYFIKNRAKNFTPIMQFGISVLLSMPIMIYQTLIVYGDGDDNSILISANELIDYVFGNVEGSFFTYEISNLLFPMFVVVVMIFLKQKKEDIDFKRIIQAISFFEIAHLEQLLITETGDRWAHGNYAWGMYGLGFILYMVSITEWVYLYKNGQLKNKWIYGIGIVLFTCHIASGIAYFILLFSGRVYII